jgi:hypothetical protein
MRVYIHSDSRDTEVLDGIDRRSRIRDVIVVAEEDLVFAEDQDLPVELDGFLETVVVEEKEFIQLHRHRCSKVDVSVRYNSTTKRTIVAPGRRLQRILDWAIEAFAVDPSAGADLTLRLADDNADLDMDDHVGSFAPRHVCSASFDLGPAHRFAR